MTVDPDRRDALDWADTARRRRAQVRDELRDGSVDLASVMTARTEDPALGAVRLLWVLESVPGARKISTRRALAAMGVDPAMALAAIDDALAAVLVERFSTPVGDEQ
ncbi:MAG: hypothetical protein M3Y51_10230 [Actinomycetota bacterium]|nr:hypothetical protein [Actinomycetota bacterium]